MIEEVLIKTAAAVLISAYLPMALNVLWKYLISPVIRLVSFPFVRIYRDNFKDYSKNITEFVEIKFGWHEFFFHWFFWVRYGGKYPMSFIEETKYWQQRKRSGLEK